MHRKLFRPQAFLLGGLLFALLASGRPGLLQAQLPLQDTAAITVPTGTEQLLQMGSKKNIKVISSSRENVLKVEQVKGDPSTVRLIGQDAGITHLELTDVDGKVEKFNVIVTADVEFLRIQLKQLAPSANIDVIPISNTVIILRGTVNHIEDVPRLTAAAQSASPGMQLVTDLRVVGDQQVQLCVTVAQVSRSELRSMTFDFLTDSKNFFFGSTIGGAVAQPPLVGIGSSNLNVTGLGGQILSGVPGPNSNLLFGVIHNRWGFLGFLQALRTEGVVKSINEPTVTTTSGRPASFLVGGEQAIPVPAGLGQVGVQFEEFGTRLNVVPIVLGNGKIRLEIEPEVSALNAANGTSIDGVVVPGRTTTRINTTVELEDGQTFVIGGLVQKDVTGTALKTPVLGDLPFFGAAFRSMSYQEDETEMVMLVTPHLVDAEDCNQAPKILPGEETRSPDDFELFLEGILEAPRGPRQVFEDHRYIAAYKNSPTATVFPCAGGLGGNGACNGGCSSCGGAPAVSGRPVPADGAVNQPTHGDDRSLATPNPMAPLMPPVAGDAAKPQTTLAPMPPDAAKPPTALAPLPPTDAANAPPVPAPPASADSADLPPIPAPPAPGDTTKPAAPAGSLPADLPPAVTGPGDEPK